MSDPNNNSSGNNTPTDKDDKKEPESILKILDELLSHTNSSRRLFLIFIASALFFGPAAFILGGILLEHPDYNIRHLERGAYNFTNMHDMSGMHLQVVDQNGNVVKELPMMPPPGGERHIGPIFLGLRIFIAISLVFAAILLFVAIKEYRFFSHWNKKFTKYRALKDKVDKELDED